MELYFPTEFGERLAFCSAMFIALIGVVVMFAPGYTYRFLKLQVREGRFEAYGEARSAGGFLVGFALTAILLQQTSIYIALGASFAVAAFGRILSLMSDRGSIWLSALLLIVSIVLAALPLLYGLGYI